MSSLFRKLAHLQEQLGEAGLNALLSSDNTGKVKAFCETLLSQFPSQIHAADLIPNGCRVVEDVEPTEFNVEDLEFPTFLEAGETSIGGDLMRERAVNLKANFGLTDGKRILANQGKIPVEMRGKYIVLTGTKLRDPDGCLCVACLYWDDDRWVLDFIWLDDGFGGYDRLVRRKET